MTSSAFGKQIQNRNFLSGVAFKFNLAKFPKVDFFSNSARIPELSLELATQASYLKNIDVTGERLTFGDFTLRFLVDENMETEETITCFNPRIIKRYEDDVWCEEGCLSFPDEIINIQRPDRIVVKYEDEDKKDHKIKLSGMAARIFLHEFDHLQGIVFTDHK